MSFGTIDADGPWEYLPVLNECIRILFTIAFGFVMSYFKIFQGETFVPIIIKFIFYVSLPFHVFNGLGIGINLYDDSFLWDFIVAFLILRALVLFASFGFILHHGRNGGKKGIGDVAVMWLSLAWISTVLGIPVLGAVFNNPAKGIKYGILAGISSLIFQLPLQLLFLECHRLGSEFQAAQLGRDEEDQTYKIPEAPEHAPVVGQKETTISQEESGSTLGQWLKFASKADTWKRILFQLLMNPIIWGLIGGFILSLSTIGPRFLNVTSKEFVPGFGWIGTTAGWLSNCLSPMSLFTMGVYVQGRASKPLSISAFSTSLFMLAKLFVIPLVMVALAKAFNFNDEAGRAAVLISSLPIVAASFPLASQYNIEEGIISDNIVLGTILMIPTVLLWNLAMDAIDLFPLHL